MVVSRKRTEAKRARASAKAIFDAARPTLMQMKKYFAEGDGPVSRESIKELLTTTEPDWVETAKRAQMIATGLRGYGPFEWNVESVTRLREERPVVWLEQELARCAGMGAASVHNLVYRNDVAHREAK